LNPSSLDVSTSDVYWTNGGDPANAGQGGAVMRVAKAGGSPTSLVPSQANASGIHVDATHIYWITPSAIHRVPLGGGPPTMLAAATSPGGLELHDNSVYWYESSAVRKVPRAGGTPVTLMTGTTSGQCDIVVDDNRIYWAASSTIRMVPFVGGSATNIVSGQSNSCGLALTSSNLVWTNLANGGAVMKAALDGSGPTAIASGRMGPQSVIVDGSDVYWTENGVVGGAASALVRAPLSGGTPQILASWPRATVGMASQLSQDADALYWVIVPPPGSPNLGFVMKLAKP
jgi:hypothetical protein